MIRALLLFLLILLAIASSVMTRLNLEPVIFHYYFGSMELPLSILVIAALIVGAVVGLVLTIGVSLSTRAERRRLHRTLQLREQEIRNLRDIPIKGRH